MELKGQINGYERKDFGTGRQVFYTLNLATGVTPFVKTIEGLVCQSLCYNLRDPRRMNVQHAWYRPAREEFDELHVEIQDHVLNGGLLLARLGERAGLKDDPTVHTVEFETFQAWCLEYYGRRLPPMTPVPGVR